MNPEFYPISYWLTEVDAYWPCAESYVHLAFALANEDNE